MTGDSDSISIERCTTHETEAFLDLYVDLFYEREPLTGCIGFTKEQMAFVARNLYAGSNNLLSQGLCWIARDRTEENRGVGIIACDDPVAAGELRIPEGISEMDAEKIMVAMGLLEEIGRPMKERLAQGEGTCLHVAAVGVAPEYEGAGIATRLLQTALSEAGSRGFRYVFAECTSPASRRLHEKAGFTCLHRVSVSSFTQNGRTPMPDCDLDIDLMVKSLDEGVITGAETVSR